MWKSAITPHRALCIAILLLIGLHPHRATLAQELAESKTLEGLKASYGWTNRVSMKIKMKTTVTHAPDKIYESEFVFMNDNMKRVHWLGSDRQIHKATGDVVLFHSIPADNIAQTLFIADGERAQLFSEENRRGDKRREGFMTVQNTSEAGLAIERARTDRGGYVLGYFYPFSLKSLPDLLSSAEVTTHQEDVNGVACDVLKTETPEGRITVWIAPELEYSVQRCRLEKEAGKHLDFNGETFSTVSPFFDEPSKVDRFIFELDNVTMEKKDGHYVTTGASFRFSEELASGVVDVMETQLTISDIDLAPDFDAMNAFKFSVPDGMQVMQRSDDGNSSIGGFEWRDGVIVASIKNSDIEAIKKSVVALSADTLPTPAKTLDWDVLNESGVPRFNPQKFLFTALIALGALVLSGLLGIWWLRTRIARP